MDIREECKNDDRLIDEPSPDAITDTLPRLKSWGSMVNGILIIAMRGISAPFYQISFFGRLRMFMVLFTKNTD